jgi:chemotaxis-related protein WspB
MLFLLFQLGQESYALEGSQVVEVLPLVGVKTLPHAPPGIAGVLNYHGAPVPVIDLSEMTLGRPAQRLMSTRIILVHYAGENGGKHLLGLIAERATETRRRDPDDFVASGVSHDGAAYLGPVAPDVRGFIQWIKVDKLLPPTVRGMLFQPPLESS